MERYVKKFKESDNKLKESFEFDIMNVFENNINGYGGPGIDHLAQYNHVILLIIKHITKDTIEVLDSISGPEEDSVVNEYSEKDKIKLKKIVSELKKLKI